MITIFMSKYLSIIYSQNTNFYFYFVRKITHRLFAYIAFILP